MAHVVCPLDLVAYPPPPFEKEKEGKEERRERKEKAGVLGVAFWVYG